MMSGESAGTVYHVNASGSTGVAIGDHAQVIQNIRKVYNVYKVAKGQARITAALRISVSALLEPHKLFGGRDVELSCLDAFLSEQPGGYCFVTGPSGFGKTALLANWIAGLEGAGQPVCYHFLDRAGGTSGPQATLEDLCEQLAARHELGGTLTESLPRLRRLYPRLLHIPPADGEKVVVVLDGLDEAAGWDPQPGADLFPHDLPSGVYVVFSARRRKEGDADWLADFGLSEVPIQALDLEVLGKKEITHLLQSAGGSAEPLAGETGFVEAVWKVSLGDPFYLHYLVQDIRDGDTTASNIDKQPEGLDKYLARWWNDVSKAVGEKAVQDLLGYLLVAKGPLTRDSLIDISDKDALNGWVFDNTLEQVRRYVLGVAEGGYILCHWRFQDYVARKIGEGGQVPYREALIGYCARWPEHKSPYALRYYAQHLTEAVEAADWSNRHDLTKRLVELVAARDFRQAHRDKIDDMVALQRDLEYALRCAASDTDPHAILLVVRSSLALVDHRRWELRPESVFGLAILGEIEAALRRLTLFDADLDWQQVCLLIVALLAASWNEDGASALRKQIPIGMSESGPLQMLAARLDAILEHGDPPEFELPEPPKPKIAEALVAHTSGVGHQAELLAKGGGGPVSDRALVFLAETDGPKLVAYAFKNSDHGTRLFQQYLAIHAGYYYAEYRRGALWHLLEAALRHPNPGWVQAMLPPIAAGALAGSPVEFREALPLVIRSLRAAAEDGSERHDLDERKKTALKQAEKMIEELTIGRWTGDVLGYHKRRLTALAEGYHVALGESEIVDKLLDAALRLPYGFAGFQYQACLTLAEGIRICQPDNWDRIRSALLAARDAVHNIQDPTFCARSTARYNAIRRMWWAETGFDVVATANRLHAAPSAPEFAGIHEIGEQYKPRPKDPEERMSMAEFTQANTLAGLSRLFKCPEAELRRLNTDIDWEAGKKLSNGVEVHIPDPGMATWLAPRLAAEALVPDKLSDQEQIRLIQSLVPLAAASPTALDTVLARLALAARHLLISDDLLGTLSDASATASWEPADPLAEMVTSFVP
jgi:hypothetical protein